MATCKLTDAQKTEGYNNILFRFFCQVNKQDRRNKLTAVIQ